MMDLAIILFVTRAFATSARLRWPAGIGCALVAAAAWMVLAVAGWCGHGAERWGMNGAWMLVLLGPSSIVVQSTAFPFGNLIGHHANTFRGGVASVALAGIVLGARRAKKHSPISDEAVRWNRGTLAFVPPLLLVIGQLLLFVLSRIALDE